MAQWRVARPPARRLWLLAPTGALGGIACGILLLNTGEQAFRALVPFLILFAAGVAGHPGPAAHLDHAPGGAGGKRGNPHGVWTALPVGLGSIYGGYFGAGLSVIVLAVLGIVLGDSLTRLNALKQIISFSINIVAAIFFLFSGHVVWWAALVMAAGAPLGGVLGGRLAGWIRPEVLRRIVVAAGVVIALIYWVR